MTTDAPAAPPRETPRAIAVEQFAIAAAFLTAIAAARPWGNFPLNDDGLYARPVFEFVRTGQFHLTYAAASVRAQILWGALWVRLLGESHEVLRLSTILLAVATIAIVNRLIALTAVPRSLRIVATLAFAFHPIFFWSTTTFMTEVPFVFTSALAMLWYVRGLSEERRGFLVAAGCAVVAAFWVRQTGVMNAVPPVLYLLAHRRSRPGRWLADALVCAAPGVLFVAIFLVRREWLSPSPMVGWLFQMWGEATFRLPEQTALVYHYFLYTFQTNAIGFLPLVAAAAASLIARGHSRDRAITAAAAILTGIGTVELIAARLPFPYYGRRFCCELMPGSILMNFGLGPPTLPDIWGGLYEYPFGVGYGPRIALTVVVGLIAAVLVGMVFTALRDTLGSEGAGPRQILVWIAIAHAAIATTALCSSSQYVDRYSFDSAWSLVIVATVAVPWATRRERGIATVVLAAMMVFAVVSVQEYFAWNRARWTAWGDLRSKGIALKDIDGGAEAFNTYEVAFERNPHRLRAMLFGHPPRRYVLSFHPMPGFRVIARTPFSGWLGLHRGEIYTLERLSGTSG